MKLKVMILCCLFITLSAAAREEIQRDGVHIYFAEKDRNIAVMTAEDIAAQQDRLKERYGLSVQPVHIYIAKDEEEYRKLAGSSSPLWSAGLASGDRMLVKSPAFSRQTITEFRRTLLHETVHLALNGLELPRWFNEGLAQYESENFGLRHKIRISRAVWQDELILFREIENLMRMPAAKADLAYAQSIAAVDHLIGKYGVQLCTKCLYFTKKYTHFSTGFRNAYLMSPEVFERQWREHVKDEYRLYILLDVRGTFWLLITGLFLLGYLATRVRRRHLLKKWEQEDEANSLYADGQDENTYDA
jgi:hypothetical protein